MSSRSASSTDGCRAARALAGADLKPLSRPAKPAVASALTADPSLDVGALPPAVRRTRARLLQSVRGGDIDDLLVPIGWNEVRPLFQRGQPQVFDPIGYLKQRSFDGQGREMLRILGAVLNQAFAHGADAAVETYSWPRFPVVPEREPLAAAQLAPWRCVRFADLSARTAAGGLLIHRLTIGADGTWHAFWPDV